MKALKSILLLSFCVVLTFGLVACGGGGGNTTTGGGNSSVVTSQSNLPVGDANCPNGGVSIDVGIDDNGNSVLDDSEVDDTQYVCNGADGADGINGTDGTNGTDGATGPQGPAGADGIDGTNGTNGTDGINGTDGTNGTNGVDGTNGTNGTDGLTALVATSPADIANCPAGGTMVEVGLDNNGNGVLDSGEADPALASYVCNGTDGGGAPFYSIGGTVSGLTGTLVLDRNGLEEITIASDNSFAFSMPVFDGSTYSVTIKSYTEGQTCAMSNGSGNVSGANVTDITVTCYNFGPRYSAAPGWNDYVKASNTALACDGSETGGYRACIHGGESRVLEMPGKSVCDGLTLSDALGAFDWSCDDASGKATFVSTGLKDGKMLSDLLDFDIPDWKQNSVTVLDSGELYLATSPAKWWDNPVAVDNDGGYLDGAGTIYVVTGSSDLPGGYIINAPSVGLVARPGAIINGPGAGTGSYVVSADGSVAGQERDFLWLEGAVNAWGDDVGVRLRSVKFAMLRGLAADNATYDGVYLEYYSKNNMLRGVAVSSNDVGVKLDHSYENTLSGVTAAKNDSYGVYLYLSDYNTLEGVTASEGLNWGVGSSGSRSNMLSGITVSNNGGHGIYMQSNSNNNTLSGVTVSNNGMSGVYLSGVSSNTLTRVTAVNNLWDGIQFFNCSGNKLSDIVASSNGYGVYLENAWSNYFTGLLKVGKNGGGDCVVTGGALPGLINGTCSDTGDYGSGGYGSNASDAAFYNGVSLASSFVGKTSGDSTNTTPGVSNTIGYHAYASITDWVNFDNPFRGWGREGGTFPSGDNKGQCTSGTCRIWDWSLATGDKGDADGPVILGVLALPTGDDTLTHTWYNGSTTTFLRNAVEIIGDGIGNDNALCESGETCLYAPNIGSYQGHGGLKDATDGAGFTDGAISGVTLLEYENNGYQLQP